MSNYVTKYNWKEATAINTSKYAKKTDLAMDKIFEMNSSFHVK